MKISKHNGPNGPDRTFQNKSFQNHKRAEKKIRPVSLEQIKDSTNIVDYFRGGTQEKMRGAEKREGSSM